jgi:photosystem II stability/assembly factor-like uncharacterized protein
MKTKLFVLVFLFLALNFSYSQSGWFSQNTNTSNHILSISFPNSTTTGYACGWYGTLLKTTNGGDNWFSMYYPGSTGFQCIVFTDVNTGYACGSGGTIIKTTNAGSSWLGLNSGTMSVLLILNFTDANTGYVVGYSGTLRKTTDAGITWTALNSGLSVNLTSVKFVNSNTGFVTGDLSNVLKTTNAGLTWTNILSGLAYNLGKIAFTDANTVYIPGTSGKVFKTSDGGSIFSNLNTGNSNYLISAFFTSVNIGYVSGSIGTVIKTVNAGSSWFTQTTPTTNDLHWIYFVNDLTGWACGYNGTIIKTTNGGLTIPTAPILTFPLNNAADVPLNTPFRWGQVNNAQRYTIQISTVANFAVITDSATVDTNFYNIPNGKLSNAVSYYWRVKASNTLGVSPWSTPWVFSTMLIGINLISTTVPTEFKVYNVYPNPFNPSTNIKFDIPKTSNIRISVYDLKGVEVENLYSGNVREGTYEYNWNATKYSSGVYFIRFVTSEYSSIKRMVLIK